MHCLPGEEMAAGCTMVKRQANGGSVMLWTMVCWETLSKDYLKIAAESNHVHPFLQWCFLMAVSSFSRITHSATLHKKVGSGMVWGTWQRVQGVALDSRFLRSQYTSIGCAGPTNPIHGGPTSQLAGSAAKVLVPDTTWHVQRPSWVHALTYPSCFGITRETYTVLCRWF